MQINLHGNFKEYCKWAKMYSLSFGGNLGYHLRLETITTSPDLSTTHVQDCVPRWFTLSETIVFILSAMADQRKR